MTSLKCWWSMFDITVGQQDNDFVTNISRRIHLPRRREWRPNLMPFPSRETASATKCYRLWSPSNHALFQSFSGIRFLTIVLYIYSGNNRFKKLKQNTQFVSFYLVDKFRVWGLITNFIELSNGFLQFRVSLISSLN